MSSNRASGITITANIRRKSRGIQVWFELFVFAVFISQLDDMNTVLLKTECSERKVERAKCSKRIIYPLIIKRKLV